MSTGLRQLLAARAFWVTLAFAGLLIVFNLLKSQPLSGVCVVGDVRASLAARIPAELRTQQLDAQFIGAGFGSVAVDGWEGLGDALVVGGRAYAASTRRAGVPTLVHARYFLTNRLVYVAPAARARDVLQIEPGVSLDTLWQQLAARYPDGALVSGYVQWQRLRHYAMTRPAIDGLSVHAHTTHYYTQPMQEQPDVWTYLVGFVAHSRTMPSGSVLTEKLIARRPDGDLDLPAQVLVLNAAPADPAHAPDANTALSVGRAARGSLLAAGRLALYPFENLKACEDAFVRVPKEVP